MRRFIVFLAFVWGTSACGGDEAPTSAVVGRCYRSEGGGNVDTACPSGQACLFLNPNNVCAPRCTTNADCQQTGCCNAIEGLFGEPQSYGACVTPTGGDRSLCTGPSTPATAMLGSYAGSYSLTRISDLPPQEGDVSEVANFELTLTHADRYTLAVEADGGCRPVARYGVTGTTFAPSGGCTSRRLLPGARLTVVSGTASLVGSQLTVRIDFRYSTTENADRGTLVWAYTGTRR